MGSFGSCGGSFHDIGFLSMESARTMKWPAKPIVGAQEMGNFMAFSIESCSRADIVS